MKNKVITTLVNGRFNLQLFTSTDNGKNFFYCGVGKYCDNLLDAKLTLRNLLK